jgi:phosphoribosyl-AMP cyclohydrolase
VLDPKEIEDMKGFDVNNLKYNEQGLIPCITQCAETGDVLMMAWMNAESIKITLEEGNVCYWSRSRKELWRKGATSGEWQILKELYFDCDKDALLAKVIQEKGKACHVGKRSCFSWKIY